MVERTVHIHEATMSRLDDFIAILNGTKTTPLEEEHPLDGIVLSILIHAAFSDGIVVEEEFDLLLRMMPGRELGDVLSFVSEESQRPMNFNQILNTFSEPQARQSLVAAIEAMIASDNQIAPAENAFLQRMRSELGVD